MRRRIGIWLALAVIAVSGLAWAQSCSETLWRVTLRRPYAQNRKSVIRQLKEDKIGWRVEAEKTLIVCADDWYALDGLAEDPGVARVTALPKRK